jgi:DNA-binding FrmR family transcriptional regulator
MSFSLTEKTALLQRIGHIDVQILGVERAIEQGRSCAHLLHLISAARSSVDGFIVAVIEHRLRSLLVGEGSEPSEAVEKIVEMAELCVR